jgi:hypothetical protein
MINPLLPNQIPIDPTGQRLALPFQRRLAGQWIHLRTKLQRQAPQGSNHG